MTKCTCTGCALLDARYGFCVARSVLKQHYRAWSDRYKPRLFVVSGRAFYGTRRSSRVRSLVWYSYDLALTPRQNAVAWVHLIRWGGAVSAPGMLPPNRSVADWTPDTHVFLCTHALTARVVCALMCLQRIGVSCVAMGVARAMVSHEEVDERRRQEDWDVFVTGSESSSDTSSLDHEAVL